MPPAVSGSDRVESPDPPVRRPRHLLDPADLQASHRRSQGTTESLTRVRRWVASALAVTTMLHLAAGIVLIAVLRDDLATGPRLALSTIAGVVGLMAVVAGLVIHGRRPLSWWDLLGLVPMLVGFWFVL